MEGKKERERRVCWRRGREVRWQGIRGVGSEGGARQAGVSERWERGVAAKVEEAEES